MKRTNNNNAPTRSTLLLIITLAALATFALSLATFFDDDSSQDVDSQNALTGQAQKVMYREQVSLQFAPSQDPDCEFTQTDDTSYTLSKDCGYPVTAQVLGPRNDQQRVAIYTYSKSRPIWEFARLSAYDPASGWDAKTKAPLPFGEYTWDLNLEMSHTPGVYTYRISTVNANCRPTWAYHPDRSCQGFMAGAYKDYTITVK